MNTKPTSSEKTVKPGVAYLAVIAVAATLGAGAAYAIPPGQRDVDTNHVFTDRTALNIVPDSSVIVDNGSSARDCILKFSAEVEMCGADGMRLGYAVDSLSPFSCSTAGGPELFHKSDASCDAVSETRTAVHVKNIPAGTHTIRPCYAASDLTEDDYAYVNLETHADRAVQNEVVVGWVSRARLIHPVF